jgi:hypothetical protein
MQQRYTIKIHKSDGTMVVKHAKTATSAVVLEFDVLEYFPPIAAGFLIRCVLLLNLLGLRIEDSTFKLHFLPILLIII